MSGEGWVRIQQNTFLNWVNVKLESIPAKVEDPEKDFDTGIRLNQLMEVLTGKAIRYNKAPKMKAQELENLTTALGVINGEGLKLVNIGPGDIHDGNTKLILGLLWTIIYHYQVSKGFKEAAAATPKGEKPKSAKDLLLEWVRSKIPEYNISNFTSDWSDGRAICALTNAIGGEPALLADHKTMAGTKVSIAQKGIESAHHDLGVPRLISAADLTNPDCDELSIITYVSCFRDAQRIIRKSKADEFMEARKAEAAEDENAKRAEAAAKAAAEQEQRDRMAAAKKEADKANAPWERPVTWRQYTKPDLGGRLKIRGYYSTTTSSQKIRNNTRVLQDQLAAREVHLRPDFVPWTAIDVDMDKAQRDALFERAGGHKETPLLFVDDEFAGTFEQLQEKIESGTFDSLFAY